jgi:hypothetical protein
MLGNFFFDLYGTKSKVDIIHFLPELFERMFAKVCNYSFSVGLESLADASKSPFNVRTVM